MKTLRYAVGGFTTISLLAVGGIAAAQSSFDDFGGSIFDEPLTLDLKVNGQDGPVEVAQGERVVVSWLSDGAHRCRGNWNRNDIAKSGTIAGRLSRSVVVKAACIDRAGNRVDDSVVVNISGQAAIPAPTPTTSAQPNIPAPAPYPVGNTGIGNVGSTIPQPTVDLKINGSDGPVTIKSGSSVIPSWTSRNAVSCATSWSNITDTSSSGLTIGPLNVSGTVTANRTYAVTCYSDGRALSVTDRVVVYIEPTPQTADPVLPPENKPPIIKAWTGPASLAAGEMGTWSVTAADPDGTSLVVRVFWGDASSSAPSIERTLALVAGQSASAEFVHAYAIGNFTYFARVEVTDSAGAKVSQDLNIAVGPRAAGSSAAPAISITVTEPRSSYIAPTSGIVAFNSTGVNAVRIEACVHKTDCTILAPSVSVSAQSTSWRWDITGNEPFVGAIGEKPIYIRVNDTISDVSDFTDSPIYVVRSTSGAGSGTLAGTGAAGNSFLNLFKAFFGR